MKLIKSALFLMVMYGVIHCSIDQQEINVHFDRLYPITNFKRVEIVCRELWFDLDQLCDNPELQKKIVENTHYLTDQFLLLEKCLGKMANDSEESISYLTEDIEYLAGVLGIFYTKYNQIYTQLFSKNLEVQQTILNSLKHSQEYVVQLFSNNTEVIL